MNALLIIINKDLLTTLMTESVSNYIRGMNGWAKLLDNVWIVKTFSNAITVRDQLRQLLPQTGGVIVFDISNSAWASSNYSNEIINWIKNNL